MQLTSFGEATYSVGNLRCRWREAPLFLTLPASRSANATCRLSHCRVVRSLSDRPTRTSTHLPSFSVSAPARATGRRGRARVGAGRASPKEDRVIPDKFEYAAPSSLPEVFD